MFLRKCSLSDVYALLESESVLGHVDLLGLLNTRNACKHPIVSRTLFMSVQNLLPSSILTGAQAHKDYSSPPLLSLF